jgi:hypothetical protein
MSGREQRREESESILGLMTGDDDDVGYETFFFHFKIINGSRCCSFGRMDKSERRSGGAP